MSATKHDNSWRKKCKGVTPLTTHWKSRLVPEAPWLSLLQHQSVTIFDNLSNVTANKEKDLSADYACNIRSKNSCIDMILTLNI